MFCKQCGKPIDDGQELCEDCKNAAGANNNANQGTAGQTINSATTIKSPSTSDSI